MPETDPCPICGEQANSVSTSGDTLNFDCPRCGKFGLTGTARSMIDSFPRDKRHILSGWIADQNALGGLPELSSDTLKMVRNIPQPRLSDQMDRLLRAVVESLDKRGSLFELHNPRFISAIYGQTSEDVEFVTRSLIDRDLVKEITLGKRFKVTTKGYLAYEDLLYAAPATDQGFVAMWFHTSMQEVYEQGFEKGVRAAGFNPVRVDRVEHSGKIDDEIIAQIRRSRFVVADFTGHRGGVYFEAGFALGLNLPVFFTCRKDGLNDLHFDVRQYNTIDWEDAADLADRLEKRIAAVIGDGPYRNA